MKISEFCHYYKGEANNPFQPYFSDKWRWWFYESQYFRNGELHPNHKHWEELAVNAKDDIPAIKHLMNDDLVPIETKGFLAYSVGTTLTHSAMEDFKFFEEYGRGFIPSIVYDGNIPEYCTDFASLPELNKKRIRKGLIESCRYYKGEKENPMPPADIRATFWEVEQIYVTQLFFDNYLRRQYTEEFIDAFPDRLNSVDDNKTPDLLKALLFQQSGSDKSGFLRVLLQYIESE